MILFALDQNSGGFLIGVYSHRQDHKLVQHFLRSRVSIGAHTPRNNAALVPLPISSVEPSLGAPLGHRSHQIQF